MQWSLPSEPSSTDQTTDHTVDHRTDHIMDHGSEHSTDHIMDHGSEHSTDHIMDHGSEHSTDRIMDHGSEHSTDPNSDHITDHSTDHIMDHRNECCSDHITDHSTDGSTDDLTDRSNSSASRGSLCQPSGWSSDSELDRVGGRRGGGRGRGGRHRDLHQDYGQFYRENRPASCPPAPEHRAPSPPCHPDNAARAGGCRNTPVGESGAVGPEDQRDGRQGSSPGPASVSHREGSGVESVCPPPPVQPPRAPVPSVGVTGGEAGQLGGAAIQAPMVEPPWEGAEETDCGPPKTPAKPSLESPPQERAPTSSSTSDPRGQSQEGEAEPGQPQDEGDQGGDAVGTKVPPPSASPPTRMHRGQRSSTAASPPPSPAQRSSAARETAAPGRAHRWRWTPEHKLQPEFKPSSGRRALPHLSTGSEESDIPPFAERMRFFEETSRSRSVSHLPGLTGAVLRPRARPGDRRRYSFQDTEVYAPPESPEPADPELDRRHAATRVVDPAPERTVDVPSSSGSPRDSSTFRPIAAMDRPEGSQQPQRSSHSSATPTDVQLNGDKEQTQLNGTLSPKQSDHLCPGDPQTAEGALTQDSRSPRDKLEAPEELLVSSVDVEVERSRAHEGKPSDCGGSADSAREAVLGGAAMMSPKRKKDPPPRPPPPKWAQFHHRRASCHALLSSPLSPPPSPLRPAPCPEVSRQRSHSFPLRDGGECCLSVSAPINGPAPFSGPALPLNPAPCPSSTFTHRAFRHLALPVEQNPAFQHPDPLRRTGMHGAPQPHPRFYALPGRPITGDHGPDTLQQRMEAEKGRRPTSDARHRADGPVYSPRLSSGVPAYSFQQSSGIPVQENGSVSKANLPEPYFTMACRPQSRTFSENQKMEAAPTHNAMGAGGGMPLETDIDQYLEEQRVQCLSRSMPVLETDLDSLPETRPSPTGSWSAHGGSLVDLLLEGGLGAGKRTDLTGEPLLYDGEGPSRETWRGGGSISRHRPDMARSSHPAWGSSASQGPGSSSSYYSTSSPAEDQLLGQGMELSGRMEEETNERVYKKQQLMERVRRRLGVLREAQRGLQEDARENARLGEEVEAVLQAVCRPSDVDRFRAVSGDLEKVLSLLLSLSNRLLRVETALEDLSADNHHTRLPLLEKKQQLLAQMTEAQELKEHVDGRQRVVCRALGGSLTADQLRDYSHFLRMKAALLVEQRQLEDRIRQQEQQLRALRESLAPSNGSPAGLGYSYY